MGAEAEGGEVKRYLVFGGSQYYPGGGWQDFQGDYASLKEAQEKGAEVRKASDWVELVDLESMEVIEHEEEP